MSEKKVMSEEAKQEIREGMEELVENANREEAERLRALLAEVVNREKAAVAEARKVNDELRRELMVEQCQHRKTKKELDAALEENKKLVGVIRKNRKSGRRRKTFGAGMILFYLGAAVILATLAGAEVVPVWTAIMPGVCAVSIGAVTGWTE